MPCGLDDAPHYQAELIALVRSNGKAQLAPEGVGAQCPLCGVVFQRDAVIRQKGPPQVLAFEQMSILIPSSSIDHSLAPDSSSEWKLWRKWFIRW